MPTPIQGLKAAIQAPLPPETTPLGPGDQALFQAWGAKNHLTDLKQPEAHYDYPGFWQANPNFQRSQGQHLPDTFKQHGHPSFSRESQYSAGPNDGGMWDENTFLPALATSKHNVDPNQLAASVRGLMRNEF